MIKQLWLIILLMVSVLMMAQNERKPIEVKGKVSVYSTMMKAMLPPEELYLGIVSDEKLAQKIKDEINQVSKYANTAEGEADASKFVKNVLKKYDLNSHTRRNGTFEKKILPGMAIIFITIQDSQADYVVIKEGVTEYNLTINVQRSTDIIATGKGQEKEEIGGGITGDPDDGNEYFPVKIKLLPDDVWSNSRLIVQTYAVDCQLEDTVENCRPLVLEGVEYHEKQDKRMGYDYRNDKLAEYYLSHRPLREGEGLNLDTVVVFKKPNHLKGRPFKGPFIFTLEDFHHVYKIGGWGGTCLRERPFKFLDFRPALAELALSEEFYEIAEQQMKDVKQNLELTFEVGKAEFTRDSLNGIVMNRLISELQSYGESLVAPSIIGYASPDGNRANNENLARMRAEKARSLIAPHLRGKQIDISVRMFEWIDVVNDLELHGFSIEAADLKSVIDQGGNADITGSVKAMPCFASVIEPVLKKMRMMQCKYMFIEKRALTPQECLTEYYKNKQAYIRGEKKFSNGDYYHLYQIITDSLELDTLTMFAYKHITQYEDYQVENPIAPYIANRWALMNLKRGTPDSKILAPFINYSRKKIDADQFVSDRLTIKVNRLPIVINQAVTYYQEQRLDGAEKLIKFVEQYGTSNRNLDMLKSYMALKRYHYLKPRSGDNEKKYQEAKKTVLDASDDNKAILYTEIKDWDMRSQAGMWVDRMDDADPKKWYLKGILAVETAGKDAPLNFGGSGSSSEVEADSIGGGFVLLTEEQKMSLMESDYMRYTEYMTQLGKYLSDHDGKVPEPKEKKVDVPKADDGINTDSIPYYLAYFQHAFDLEPSYKRLYFSEGHVPEEVRLKYKYKKKNIAAYRKIFEALKSQKVQPNNNAEEESNAEDNSSSQEVEPDKKEQEKK